MHSSSFRLFPARLLSWGCPATATPRTGIGSILPSPLAPVYDERNACCSLWPAGGCTLFNFFGRHFYSPLLYFHPLACPTRRGGKIDTWLVLLFRGHSAHVFPVSFSGLCYIDTVFHAVHGNVSEYYRGY